jgi:hypothetical protein
MDDPEVTVTVRMRGLARPEEAANYVAMFMKRSLYRVDGLPDEFAAEIDAVVHRPLPEQMIRIEI